MSPKSMPFLALVLIAGFASEPSCYGRSVVTRVRPTDHDLRISVRSATGADFGYSFTVSYTTNEYTRDKFLHARLDVCAEDEQIASNQLEKTWTTNGIQFEFTISSAYLSASKFTIIESAHSGETPMPGLDAYWFYLRDFVTNGVATSAPASGSIVSAAIIKELRGRIRELGAGISEDHAWKQLGLARYKGHLGGESYPEKDRFVLTWNYDLELTFEQAPTNSTAFHDGNRKLVRATLYKNGLAISASRK